MEIRVSRIDWETDGEEVDLPTELLIDAAAEGIENPDQELADWLSDKYGWCVKSVAFEPVTEQRLGTL